MKNICFCFQMHAPYRLKRYRFFEIGQDHYYYEDMATEEYLEWLTSTSYLPLAKTILEMTQLSKSKFHCALSISGTMLELWEQYIPEMIDVLKQLAETRCIEFLATPYSYSLASQFSETEFSDQMLKQSAKIEELFGQKPQSLWNTELLYSDDIADIALKMGYKTILTEGAKHILSWKSPNYVYQSCVSPKQRVLLRNMNISDNLSFHFSDPQSSFFPMDAEKFISQINSLPQEEQLINLWMGAEAYGIWQPAGTGIFEFLKALPYFAMEQDVHFVTPTEAVKVCKPVDTISSPFPLTWSGESKDLSIFTGNDLQQEALNKLYAVAERVHLCKDLQLKADWLILQDVHFMRYMNHIDRGASNYESAYDAFINYMNILADFLQRVEEQYPTTIENEELNSLLKTINNQEKELQELRQQLRAIKKKK